MNVVVGAGPAGLACARELCRRGEAVVVLEASDRVGGRLRTERSASGFFLDRGFQVLLDNYQNALRLVALEELQPRYFRSGALVWTGHRFGHWENPLRQASGWLSGLLETSLPWGDKLRLVWLVLSVLRVSEETLRGQVGRPGSPSCAAALQQLGFSPVATRAFFQPFFGGVLLDPELHSDFALLRLYLRRFALGRAFLPTGGIGQYGAKVAAALPSGTLHLGARVVGWEAAPEGEQKMAAVRLADGALVRGKKFFACSDALSTRTWLGAAPQPKMLERPWASVQTYYYAPLVSVLSKPWLVLNGSGGGPVAHCCEVSRVDPTVAPPGRHLFSATVLPTHEEAVQESEVRQQLESMFPAFRRAELLEVVNLPAAVPWQRPEFIDKEIPLPLKNLVLAGDQVTLASTEESVRSGLDAAGRLC